MSWTYSYEIISQWFLPFQRLVLFVLTGKVEFERILANRLQPFACRVHQLKSSLNFSLTKTFDDDIQQAKLEKTKSIVHDQYYIVLKKFQSYQQLVKNIETIRLTKVTSTDETHLDLFEKIWSRLVRQSTDDQQPMEMISKRWTKIGFQGSNPLTDFRGMGLLGLQSIEYLSRNQTLCLSYVNIPPPNDYSFAIGMINIVSWLVHLLEHPWSPKEKLSYPLLTHFSCHPCNLDEFFRLFALVVNEWNEYWLAHQANIMQFEQLSKRFRTQLFAECQQWRPIQAGFAKQIS